MEQDINSVKKIYNNLNKSNFKIINLIFYIIFHIIILIIMNEMQFEGEFQIKLYTYIAFIQLILSFRVLKLYNNSLLSLSTIFILLSFIFHFGQLILYTLSVPRTASYDVFSMVPMNIIIKACKFTFFSVFFIVLGIIICTNNIGTKKIKGYQDNNNQLVIIYKVGITLLIIGIIPKLYNDIGKIILFFRSGYLATYTLNTNGILAAIGNMAEYGVFLIMIGKQNNKKLLKKILICFLVYQLFVMISGNRGRATVVIISALYIFFNTFNNIKVKNIIKYGIFGYIGVVILTFIGNLRGFNSITTEIISNTIFTSFSSVFIRVLDEFGSTVVTLSYSIKYFPDLSVPTYGLNYITSLISVIPNFGDILNKFKDLSVYVYKFPFYEAFGGSYLGELYYSFNEVGIYFAIFIGFFIGIISNNLMTSKRNKNWLYYSICMIFFPNILWWIRGYFYDMVRDVIWTMIVIRLLYSYFVKYRPINNNRM